MTITLPNIEEIRSEIRRLNISGIKALSEKSDVPYSTLIAFRAAISTSPNYTTVCAFLPLIDSIAAHPEFQASGPYNARVHRMPRHHKRGKEWLAQREAAKASKKESR